METLYSLALLIPPPPKTTFFVSKRICTVYVKWVIIGLMLFALPYYLEVFVKVPMILAFSSNMTASFLSTFMIVFFLLNLMMFWIPFLPP
jgi:hypothetical protein